MAAADDRRLEQFCRMGLLAAAVLHWIVFGLLVWSRPDESYPPIRPSNRALSATPSAGPLA